MYCMCSKRTRAEQNIIIFIFQYIMKLLLTSKRIMYRLGNLLHRKWFGKE